ncbi:S8 family serine peptidase [Halobacillus seohaensis]|uniref:S8 family serine peptidase n=1 Tax=Halobacillus seohaensis TaxID=447421 RepID=A0ABW2ENY7_9BACI
MPHKIAVILLTVLLLTGFSQPEPDEEITIILELKDTTSAAFKSQMESRLPRLEVVAEYETIFNGVAIRGTPHELEKVSRLSEVVNQYPVKTYTTQGKLSTPIPSLTTDIVRPNTPFTGEGVKVGVIDTGIDYTHPDLKENFRGGFDLIDFDDDPMETTEMGATIHGSHVAGVIGADGDMKGVAPGADLYAYRALGPGGMGSSVQVIAAIEEAVEDGMDVINLSLGNDVNGPDWPTTKAVDQAIKLGTTVVVAAGNSGPNTWTIGSPATSPNAITVGASSLPTKQSVLTVPGEDRQIKVQLLQGSNPWDLSRKFPVQHISGNNFNQITGKIVLIDRGGTDFAEKAELAYQKGAEAVIIVNNSEDQLKGSIEGKQLPIPVAAVTKGEGKWLKEKAIKQDQWVETIQREIAHTIAPFSSRGPVTTSWSVKPDILAPGVNVISTVPGGYQVLQGTSMAAPHIAGVAAILKEAHPEWSPEDIKTSLMSTANLLQKSKSSSFPPTEQGAGYVDTAAALEPELWIKPGALNFGKVEGSFFREEVDISIRNQGDETQTIRFKQPKKQAGLAWSVPPSFHVSPGEEVVIPLEVQITNGFVKEGIHEGYIEVESDTQEYHIPYLFMMDTADYEKITGLEFSKDWDSNGDLVYRFNLTETVDKLTVDLYRSGTMLHHGKLLELDDPEEGLNEGKVDLKITDDFVGSYIAVVTVEIDGEKFSYPFPVRF